MSVWEDIRIMWDANRTNQDNNYDFVNDRGQM